MSVVRTLNENHVAHENNREVQLKKAIKNLKKAKTGEKNLLIRGHVYMPHPTLNNTMILVDPERHNEIMDKHMKYRPEFSPRQQAGKIF